MKNEVKDSAVDLLLLAQKVNAKRTKKHWGFRRVAISAGVSHMAVKRLEEGRVINKNNAEALAKWAGLTSKDLTTGQTHLKL